MIYSACNFLLALPTANRIIVQETGGQICPNIKFLIFYFWLLWWPLHLSSDEEHSVL